MDAREAEKEQEQNKPAEERRTTVDVVIPVYNEEKDLARSVTALRQYLLDLSPDWTWRIVVADNASTDRTLEIARELAARWPEQVGYVHLDQKGRGRALRRAWSESAADVVCYMDVDLSTDLAALPPLVEALRSGYDVAIGSRLLPESRVERGLKREIISRTYNLIVRTTHGATFKDAQCGFKGVTRRVVEEVVPLVQDQAWFFDSELLLVAEGKGYRIKEIPVAWTDDPDSRVRIARTAWEDLKGLWRLKWHFPGERKPMKGSGLLPSPLLVPVVVALGGALALAGWLARRLWPAARRR